MVLAWCVISLVTLLISGALIKLVPAVMSADAKLLGPLLLGLGVGLVAAATDGSTRAMDVLEKARPVYEPWEFKLLESRVRPFRRVFQVLRVFAYLLPVAALILSTVVQPLTEKAWFAITALFVFLVLAGAWSLAVRFNLDNIKLRVDDERQSREQRRLTLEKLLGQMKTGAVDSKREG